MNQPKPLAGRPLVWAFHATLPLLEKAAKKAARERRQLDRIQCRYHLCDEGKAWTILLLERLHTRHETRPWTAPGYKPETYEDLCRRAKAAHWADVVYENGSNNISWVRI